MEPKPPYEPGMLVVLRCSHIPMVVVEVKAAPDLARCVWLGTHGQPHEALYPFCALKRW